MAGKIGTLARYAWRLLDSAGNPNQPDKVNDIPAVFDAIDARTTKAITDFGNVDSSDLTSAANDIAFAAAVADYGPVFVPEGTYQVTSFDALGGIDSLTGPGKLRKVGSPHVIRTDREIRESVDLWAYGDFSDIYKAIAYIHARPGIKYGAVPRIRIPDSPLASDGVTRVPYDISQEIIVDSPQGRQVQIVGNEGNRDSVVLRAIADNNLNCFRIPEGRALGLINGLTITGTGWLSPMVWDRAKNPFGAAVRVVGGSVVIGPLVYIEKNYYGVSVIHAGRAAIAAGVLVGMAGDVGVHSVRASSISCNGIEVAGCGETLSGLGAGILSELSSSVECETAKSHDNFLTGFGSYSASALWALSTEAYGNKFGFLSDQDGSINVVPNAGGTPTDSHDNQYGFKVQGNKLSGYQAKARNNTADGVNVNGAQAVVDQMVITGNSGAALAGRNRAEFIGTPATATGNGQSIVDDGTSIFNAVTT